MADEEETPQQRQIRIRQAKREAKLKASGQDRLDKITKLSGRTPETMRDESPATQSPAESGPTQTSNPSQNNMQTMPPLSDTGDADQMRAQEEYLRALLANSDRQGAGGPPVQGQVPDENDPMVKMMQSMLAGMSGDPNAANELPFSPDDLAKASGLPSFVTNMFMGRKQHAPPSAAEVQSARLWRVVHIVLALLAGFYTLATVRTSRATFGEDPPAPATAQNPFVIFLTLELLLQGSRVVMSGGHPALKGLGGWIQTAKDVARDGSILVFVLGVYSWWEGVVQ